MKFLCDQCKAKYQIADEKVAGKTVRMKCRKCGHMIEVRAAVTESSVSSPPPRDPTVADVHIPAAAKAPPPRPGAMATSLAGARASKAPAPQMDTKRDSTALAAAFKQTVKEDDTSLDNLSLSVSDEWYVAINGVPVGPIRIGELRRKAASGAVTDDSLVWQEGLEEWRPVRTIPDLASIVREAASGGRVSLVTPPPPEARPVTAPAAVRPAAAAPVRPAAPRGVSPPPGNVTSGPTSAQTIAAARNNVVPINARLATAERLEEAPVAPFAAPIAAPAPATPSIAPDPFALPPPAATAASALTAANAANLTAPLAMPVAAAPASIPPPSARASTKGPPWIVIAMLICAGLFGITAAIVLFMKPPPAPQVVVVPSAPAANAAPTTTKADNGQAPMDELPATPNDPNTGKPAANGQRTGALAAAPKASASAAASGTKVDPSIAALLSGPGAGGPSTGPGGGGGGGSGAALSEDQIRLVVATHSPGVKRSCWERGGSQASSANVSVHVVVAPSGAVQNATATGNDSLINSCIEKSIRVWAFPVAGGTTTIDIPFHFVRQ